MNIGGRVTPNNDAVVIDVREYAPMNNGDIHGHVLCVRDHPFHPFVIWAFMQTNDGTKDVFSGTYLSSLEDAVDKWKEVI